MWKFDLKSKKGIISRYIYSPARHEAVIYTNYVWEAIKQEKKIDMCKANWGH